MSKKTTPRCKLQGGMSWDTPPIEEEHTAAAGPKPAKKPRLTTEERENREWWDVAIGQAYDMFYSSVGWIPDDLSVCEIWEHSAEWVYGRFERLGSSVLTGISTSDLQASLETCADKAQHTPICLAWSWLRPGTLEYCQYVKRYNLEYVRQAQQEFVAGTDVQLLNGEIAHYCGLCSGRWPQGAKVLGQEVEEE